MASYPCLACPTLTFLTKAELSQHYSLFHKDGKIPCPQCKVEITTMYSLKTHLKIHKSSRTRRFKCTMDQCDKSFYTAADAKKHVAIVHSTEKPFSCPLQCGKSYKTRQEVKIHILSHTKEKSYPCGQCGLSFGQKGALNKHTKFQHTFQDGKPHECCRCGRKFKTIQTLKCHIQRIHTTQTKDFLCSDCPKNFFTKFHLMRHSETHNSQRKLPDCYFCFKRSTTRSNLERHLRRHTTETPFTCGEKGCNYFSAYATTLLCHVRNIHQKSPKLRKHTCYFCLVTLINNQGFVNHMRIHTLEEPFSCQLCRKSFKRSSDLNTHIHKLHTKEKPHKCSFCEKCFISKGVLKQHTAIHTREKRFFCGTCSYSSNNSRHLKDHCERMHKI